MPDKNLTDKEIVKALEDLVKCNNNEIDCGSCSLSVFYPRCPEEVGELALDLINRLQAKLDEAEDTIQFADKEFKKAEAENERLKKANEMFTDIGKLYSEIKAEAYKEVFEKLNEKADVRKVKMLGGLHIVKVVTLHDINALKKELVGEDNGKEKE